MNHIFLKLLNMSMTAGLLIICVLIFRLLLKKVPKNVHCFLWLLVGIRLVCPISIESAFSVLPSNEPVSQIINTVSDRTVLTPNMEDQEDEHINSNTSRNDQMDVQTDNSIFLTILSLIWLAGMAGMTGHAILDLYKVKKRVSESVPYEKQVYLCDNIRIPFILGIVKPRIYLPSRILEKQIPYVLQHEKAHLKRWDPLWKVIGYMILILHWFNPLVWAAYQFFSRDIELACDEKVIRNYDLSGKKEYSTILLEFSTGKTSFLRSPLAFGEVSVRERVKVILNYRKPAFWTIFLGIIICLGVGIGFLTSPSTDQTDEETQIFGSSEILSANEAEMDVLERFRKIPWNEIEEQNLIFTGELSDNSRQIQCIGELPEYEIRLYGYGDEDIQGEGVAIQMGEEVNYFDWIYTTPRKLPPSVYWNEKDKILQIALKIYTGTGIAAEELHVLRQNPMGGLSDTVLTLDEYSSLLQQRTGFQYLESAKKLELINSVDQTVIAQVENLETENGIEALELGMISSFVLGDDIFLQVQSGYITNGQVQAEYENMPELVFPVVTKTDDSQNIVFQLGNPKVLSLASDPPFSDNTVTIMAEGEPQEIAMTRITDSMGFVMNYDDSRFSYTKNSDEEAAFRALSEYVTAELLFSKGQGSRAELIEVLKAEFQEAPAITETHFGADQLDAVLLTGTESASDITKSCYIIEEFDTVWMIELRYSSEAVEGLLPILQASMDSFSF